MEVNIIGIIIFGYITFFVLYFVIRHAVEEGAYRALKRYKEDENTPDETMIQIGERVQKEQSEKEKQRK